MIHHQKNDLFHKDTTYMSESQLLAGLIHLVGNGSEMGSRPSRVLYTVILSVKIHQGEKEKGEEGVRGLQRRLASQRCQMLVWLGLCCGVKNKFACQ